MLAFTGLRVDELRKLRWGDLDLEGDLISVRAETTKNRRAAVLNLPPALVQMLKDWRAQYPDKPSDAAPVVDVPSTILKTFNDDLATAEIPKKDESGRTVDLHCLRHTYGTLLIQSGADIKTVQTLMRHSTPSLTLGTYIHFDQQRLRQAVEKLPIPPSNGIGMLRREMA
jgi:integrase